MRCAIPDCRYVATHDLRKTIGRTSAPFAVCPHDSIRMLSLLVHDRDARYMTLTLTSREAPPSITAVSRTPTRPQADELRGAPRVRCTIPGCRKRARFEIETAPADDAADAIAACSDDAPHVLSALASESGFDRVSVTIASRWQRPTAAELLAAHGM